MSNIPSPTPVSSAAASSSIASGGVIPTSNATGNQVMPSETSGSAAGTAASLATSAATSPSGSSGTVPLTTHYLHVCWPLFSILGVLWV